jgi:predicted MFS family arabinose efflux permease
MVTNALIVIGYIGFFLCNDPHSPLVLIFISVASFGFYGLVTLGYVMVNQHCGHKARGSVMGINCLFGALAILILSKAGGMAFDMIDKSVPFLIAAFASFILFFVVLIRKNALDQAKSRGCPIDHSKPVSAS